MGSRPESSSNPNHPSGEKNEDKESEVFGAAVAVAAVAGVAAIAAWGISKSFGNSNPEPQHQAHTLLQSSSSSSSSYAAATNYYTPTITENFGGNPGYYNPTTPGLLNEGKWTKPSRNWFKLNTDASVFPEIGKAAAGGLIRDDSGRWIVGFTACLKSCDITSAELQGLREGLSLAWERGIREVEIETDSEAALILIEKPDLKLNVHRLGSIVEDCRKLLNLRWEIKFSHVDRGRNKCADALAKRGRYQNEHLIIWEEPPLAGNVRDLVSKEMTDNYSNYI